MEKIKRLKPFSILILIIGVLIFLVVFNLVNNDKFFEASLSSCLSIGCVVGLSFFLVQTNTDKRRKKDILLRLLLAIQALITDKNAYIIDSNTSQESITMRNRSISNYLNILEEHSVRFNLKNDVLGLKLHFREYEELIGDHIADMRYLQNSQKELQRPLDLMNSDLFKIMFKIY